MKKQVKPPCRNRVFWTFAFFSVSAIEHELDPTRPGFKKTSVRKTQGAIQNWRFSPPDGRGSLLRHEYFFIHHVQPACESVITACRHCRHCSRGRLSLLCACAIFKAFLHRDARCVARVVHWSSSFVCGIRTPSHFIAVRESFCWI